MHLRTPSVACGTSTLVLLLGFTLVSFSIRQACAQAGGGGDRAVLIGTSSDTPGITVTGPFEEGFDEGVSAFIIEFTPTVVDDKPPDHASVSITITPEDGWTLQQPDPGNMPIIRNTQRGTFANDIEWQATRIVQGVPEDTATGTIKVAWAWAEFDVGEPNDNPSPGTAANDPTMPGMFYTQIGFDRTVEVTIRVVPGDLPEQIKDHEAGHWQVGWANNIKSIGRTCYYPHLYEVVWWNTTKKAAMPIYDGGNPPLWYTSPAQLAEDGESVDIQIQMIMQQHAPHGPTKWMRSGLGLSPRGELLNPM